MYIAMNRFKVADGFEDTFEDVWRDRKSLLSGVAGFLEFRLLRGPRQEHEGFTPFASYSLWTSEAAFVGWTKSAGCHGAHNGTGDVHGMYVGLPVLEGYHVVDGV